MISELATVAAVRLHWLRQLKYVAYSFYGFTLHTSMQSVRFSSLSWGLLQSADVYIAHEFCTETEYSISRCGKSSNWKAPKTARYANLIQFICHLLSSAKSPSLEWAMKGSRELFVCPVPCFTLWEVMSAQKKKPRRHGYVSLIFYEENVSALAFLLILLGL